MIILDTTISKPYKSNSQKTRVMTESWTGENIFCPNCGGPILHYKNNQPVADFYCTYCKEDYELKSGKSIGKKINDGAYTTMINRLLDDNNPNFFFLTYSIDLEISNFMVIPKHFFVPEIIEKRKPLSKEAKRAGWVGCNVLINGIPESGKIFYIKNGKYRSKKEILNDWTKTLFLRETKSIEGKGWILDIMKCIENLHKKEFTLTDIYSFEKILKQKYPNNNFIKDKIRQQLQFLRDKGYLKFISPGKYKLL